MAYISLENLDAYKLSRLLSKISWEIFSALNWESKKMIGFQFIESTDSVGANIAEGYGRFHYLDKVKFYYNARGSLLESRHWIELLGERKLLSGQNKKIYLDNYKNLRLVLNRLIQSTLQSKHAKIT